MLRILISLSWICLPRDKRRASTFIATLSHIFMWGNTCTKRSYLGIRTAFSKKSCFNVMLSTNRAYIYLFKVSKRNTRKRCEICSKLTIKIQFSSVSIVNFKLSKYWLGRGRVSKYWIILLITNVTGPWIAVYLKQKKNNEWPEIRLS